MRDDRTDYQAVAASQTAKTLAGQNGAGAIGDVLAAVIIIPATSAAGAVDIKDGSNTAINVFAGGGTTALQDLKPLVVPIQARSVKGAWQINTGTNVSVIAVGRFS